MSTLLIVNADDFGLSASVNEAVALAHREGILTTASLMVSEPAAEAAVELARQNPRLGVGLHLTLVCGRSALPPGRGTPLTGVDGRFSDNPALAGLRYFLSPTARGALVAEIDAQVKRFVEFGLPGMDHLNGHLNIHLHPSILGLLLGNAPGWGIRRMRWTRDLFRLNVRLAGGAWGYRISHAIIFRLLCLRARGGFRRAGIVRTDRVFGLLQNARMDEPFVHALLEALPEGVSELYSHPSMDRFRHETEALISERVIGVVRRRGIRLVRYADLDAVAGRGASA